MPSAPAMPGVAANRRKWAEHNWEHGGHRWSPGGTYAGTDLLWHRSIHPRIRAWLPAGTILEIAPGYGRWTPYLLAHGERLVGVDLTPSCVEVCRRRFADRRAEFFVNDGESLPMLPDASVDFAFSFDSLVHVERPQLLRYLSELARTLQAGGAAFLHHSNLGAYADPSTGAVRGYVRERHWRAGTVSARIVRDACRAVGLRCVSQELINWIGRDADVDRHRLPGEHIPLTDCLTICAHDDVAADTAVLANRHFAEEWRQLIALSRMYRPASDPERLGDEVLAPQAGPAGDATKPQAALRKRLSRTRHRLQGCYAAWRDPVARAIRARRCPDCGTAGTGDAEAFRCGQCRASFLMH